MSAASAANWAYYASRPTNEGSPNRSGNVQQPQKFSYASAARTASVSSRARTPASLTDSSLGPYDQMLNRAFQNASGYPSLGNDSVTASPAPYQPRGWQGAASFARPPDSDGPVSRQAPLRTDRAPSRTSNSSYAPGDDDGKASLASFSSMSSFKPASAQGTNTRSFLQHSENRYTSASESGQTQSQYRSEGLSTSQSRSSTPSVTSNNTSDFLAEQPTTLFRAEAQAPVAVDTSGWEAAFTKPGPPKQPIQDTEGADPELDDLVSQINALGTTSKPRSAAARPLPPPREGAWTLKTPEKPVATGEIVTPTKLGSPSKFYNEHSIKQSSIVHPSQLNGKRPKLVILDINNTLLYRKKATSSAARNPVWRPYLSTFLEYLCGVDDVNGVKQRRFSAMIWSSAQPENVKVMLELMALLSPGSNQAPFLHDVWARDSMDLTPAEYDSKFPTIKDLDKVWKTLTWTGSAPGPSTSSAKEKTPSAKWSQYDTVLIDDSRDKTQLQPFNHLLIPPWKHQKFANAHSNQNSDACLLQAIGVLHDLRIHTNISNAIRSGDFRIVNNSFTARSYGRDYDSAKTWENKGRQVCEKLGIEIRKEFDPTWARKMLHSPPLPAGTNGQGAPATLNQAVTPQPRAEQQHVGWY